MGCLYQLTSLSGKSYIGISSKSALVRFSKHIEHALGKRQNGVLYSALRKYKPENFAVKTLVIANDWQYLCDLEIKTIAAFGTRYPSGYNMTDGGEGIIGTKPPGFSDKVSIAQRKRFERPEEQAKRASALLRGRMIYSARCAARRINGKAPWEVREEAGRCRTGSAEHKAKISAAVKTAMSTPEISEKIKSFARQRSANPEWRRKISASKLGKKTKPCSLERKEKISAARRREWADTVVRQRRLSALAKARAAKSESE
jgi:hypothetical protein